MFCGDSRSHCSLVQADDDCVTLPRAGPRPGSFRIAYYCTMQKLFAGARALLARSGSRSDDGRDAVAGFRPDELVRKLLSGRGEIRELLRSETRSALGSPRDWPLELLGVANVCLDAPRPMWLVWGPESLLIYNDAAIPLLGKAHPDAFGKRAREARVDLWETVGAAVENVMLSGCPRCLSDRLLMLDSGSAIEERYFEIVASPLLRGGAVVGVLCSAVDTTVKVQAARRRETLDELDARMARAADEDEAWAAAVASLERNPADLRYAILYRTDGVGGLARLAGTAGIVSEDPRVPAIIEPAAANAPWPLAHAADLKAPIRWSDALVCPLVARSGDVNGYLIAGLSPRLEADDDYLDFVESAAERIGTGVALARAREDQVRREHTLERVRRRLEQRCADLARLIEHAPIPIVVVRGDTYEVEMANAAAIAVSGGRAVVGKPLLDALPELAVYADRLRHVLETGEPEVGHEVAVRLERGGRLEDTWFTFVGARLDDVGDGARIVIVASDVTELVRKRAALEESESRYRHIFDSVDVSIWEEDFTDALPILDEIGADGPEELKSYLERRPEFLRRARDAIRVTDVNEATVRLFGARDKRELAESLKRIFLPETWQAFVDKLVAVATRQPLTRTDTVACTLDGERRDLSMTIVGSPEAVSPGRVLVTLTDITEHKRLEQALREADRHKDEFLATLAHELRNPLASLRSSVDLLRGTTGAAPATIVDIIDRQIEHLVRLANDLYETSRIRLGTYEIRRQRVALADVLDDAIETTRSLIEAAGHELVTSLPEEPLWLDGDPMRLVQIFTNLLNNAARYTREPGRISVVARRVDDKVEIAVTDTGIGIDPDALPRLFTIFSRVGGAEKSGVSGLGIGLALAKQLAEMHGGTIEARSEGEGKGSTFVVRLPIAPPPDEGERDEPPAADSIAGSRVLLVEDHEDTAETLRMLLEANGAEVRVATTGPQALAAYARFEPDVVLLDIGLPGMSGYEVARRLRAEFPTRATMLVALTGWGRQEDVSRARDVGFDDHLVKPVDLAALRRLLASSKRSASDDSPRTERPVP